MPRGRARSGISLLEVMFSIGVVMIGLVGIAALLPVAGMQAKKGAVADAAARLGADAVRDFHVRGMANPRNWRCSLSISVRRNQAATGDVVLPRSSLRHGSR